MIDTYSKTCQNEALIKQDEDYHFVHSLLTYLNKMDPVCKLDAKMDIFMVLKKHANKQTLPSQTPPSSRQQYPGYSTSGDYTDTQSTIYPLTSHHVAAIHPPMSSHRQFHAFSHSIPPPRHMQQRPYPPPNYDTPPSAQQLIYQPSTSACHAPSPVLTAHMQAQTTIS
ncbi:hypothetical protein XELAEV_18005970mg [Xenopus laevis]|uniref:BESS domain-containing protein n=1 Tax=Xenopus laevis TaxID=8355 RepID=A0A974DZC7_XENLA|nr:hypothetical protein XELAEV_18005970mg [Xenopus laevis]